jgi:hypothetical protein
MTKRKPEADARGHCLICGGLADHVHTEIPTEDTGPEPEPDLVMMVELDPKMVAAMMAADEAEKPAPPPPEPAPKARRRGRR